MNGFTRTLFNLALLTAVLCLSACNLPSASNGSAAPFPTESSVLWDLTSNYSTSGIAPDLAGGSVSVQRTPTPQLYSSIDFNAAFNSSVPVSAAQVSSDAAAVSSAASVSVSGGEDSAAWLYFDPVEYSTGSITTLYAAFQNNGSSTWTSDYSLEFFAGKNPAGNADLTLNASAAPGEKATFEIPITISDSSWKSCWQVRNSAGEAFYEFCYNHGDGTNSSESSSGSSESSSGGSDDSGVFYAFVRTEGSAPAHYASDEQAASFSSISPADGNTFCAYDHTENVSVTFTNEGSEAWDSSYTLNFYSGYNWFHTTSVSVPGTVEPGESCTFTMPMEIFEDNDNWVTCWYLATPDGNNLADFCFNYHTRGC